MYMTPQQQAVWQTAAQLYPAILVRLYQAGSITQQEYSLLNQLNIQQQILTETVNTYGGMAVTQVELEGSLSRRIQSVALNIRARGNAIPAYGIGYGQAYTPMANPALGAVGAPMMQPGLVGGIPASEMTGSSRPDLNGSITNAQPTPTQNQTASVSSPAPSNTAKLPHTNKPYNFNLADGGTVAHMPTRTQVESPENQQPEFQMFGNSYQLGFSKFTVNSTEIRLTAPFTSRVAAVNDFITNNFNFLTGKFCHLLIFYRIELLPIVFTTGKDLFTKISTKYTGSTSSLTDIMTLIKGQGSHITEAFSDIILGQFNKTAAVNFVKFGSGTAQFLPKLSNLAELSQMLLDSGDVRYQSWVENATAFNRAMSTCLKAAFNRLFKNESKGYLDPSNPKERSYLLADDRTGFRFTGGDGRLAMLQKATPEFKQELQDKLNTRFAVLLEQRVLLHNLDIKSPPKDFFKRNRFTGSEEANALLGMYERYGTTELVDVNQPDQIYHPLLFGVSYDGSIVVQRALA